MGKWNRKVIGYEIQEVKELPPTAKEKAEHKNKFAQEILDAFLKSNAPIAKLDLRFENEDDESDPVLNGQVEYASNQIKHLLKQEGNVVITRRDGDLYLVRTDEDLSPQAVSQ
jgi:hypothetical protein